MIENRENALNILKECLFRVKNEVVEIVSLIRENNESLACRKIVNISEMLETLIGSVYGLDLNVDIERFNSIFNEIVGALENEDYGLVADLFEYEIEPLFEEINCIIK